MQGTVLVLMALSGVGCHHKACDAGYAPMVSGCYSGYASACYASYEPACYAEPVVMDGCYGGATWSGCYGDSYDACYGAAACYGGARKHRHGGLFGCFKRKRCGVCNGGYAFDSCYSASVFGAYPPVTYGDTIYGSSQIYSSGQLSGSGQAWGAAPASVDTAPTPASEAYPVESTTPPTPEPSTPPAAEPAVPAPDAVESLLPDAPAPEAAPAPNF